MSTRHFDVVVIGTGPGGEGAAMMCAKQGKKTAVVERYTEVGGGCTHWGTIPSKALRHAVQCYVEYTNNPLLNVRGHSQSVSYQDLLRSADSVITRQVQMRSKFYDRNHVEIIPGHARFSDSHTLEVQQTNGAIEAIKADHFILATGSTPFHPPGLDFNHPSICDSDSILKLERTPHSITIFGAGVIGCEYASIFGNLGLKVNLINSQDRLLSFMDDEITDSLTYHLRHQGVAIRNNEFFERAETTDRGVVVHLKSGKRIRSDVLLWAAGRAGNTSNMGLEELGVKLNKRGHVEVNKNYQSSAKHIYAVGDIIGFPSLACAAYDQGRFAATHLCKGELDSQLISDIPVGIYTIPEMSSVGRTEKELTEAQVPYEVGDALFKNLARAQMTDNQVGMLKILFHRETLAILGVHCFGSGASEIVHIGQAVMSQRGKANTLQYFTNMTFNYPTMAEAYRVAALTGLNRLS